VGNQGKSEVSNARKNEKAFNLYTWSDATADNK
jgi:hypothetical protein